MNNQNPIDAAIHLLETAVDPDTEFYNRPVLAQRALCALRRHANAMTLSAYQDAAATTALYPERRGIEYTALGLVGEAGEVANKVKGMLRGDYGREELRAACFDEIGDVLWYCAALARELDLELDAIAQGNLDKLADRKRRGAIQGDGDKR